MPVIIFILAVFLRLTNLGELPYMFDGDETYFGYYSFSLANFGTDEYGRKLPLYFSSIGDYKYPLYAYLGTVGVKLFGLTEVTTRLTSAIAGLLAIALIAIITGQLTRNIRLATYSAALMALSPWHIWMSRRALEANLGFTLILLSTATFIKKWWGLTILFAILAMFSYPASRIFVLGLSSIGSGIFLMRRKRAEFITCLIILGVGLISFISPQSRARGTDITVWSTGNMTDIQKQVDLDIHADGLSKSDTPLIITRILHNKLFYLGKNIADKAISHFDPTYLFVNGEQRDRYFTPRMGLLSYVEGLVIFLGLFYLYNQNKKLWILPVGWWILAAVAPAITTEPAHSVRYSLAIAAVAFIGSWGLISLPKFHRSIILVLLSLNVLYFWHQYSIQRTYLNPWYLEAEMQHLPKLVALHEHKYNAISVPGDVYIFFLYHNQIAPADFVSSSQIELEDFKWDRVNKFGKITFKMSSPCPKIGKLKTLYMCLGGEVPQNARVIELVRYQDNHPAFTLIEFFPISQITSEPLPEGLHRMVESDFRFNPDGLLPEDYPNLWF